MWPVDALLRSKTPTLETVGKCLPGDEGQQVAANWRMAEFHAKEALTVFVNSSSGALCLTAPQRTSSISETLAATPSLASPTSATLRV